MDYSEQLYFRDLDRYELIPPEEESEILKRVRDGDQKALHRLIVGNLRFVASIARRYRGRGLTLLELINEGNIGLHKAAKRFDPSKEVKFISYAVWWIRQSIQKALLEQVGAMRIPPNKLALVNKFKKALLLNNGDYEKTLDLEEFVPHRHSIIEILDRVVEVSLDAPIKGQPQSGGDQAGSLLDIIGDDAEQEKESEKSELREVVESLINNLSTSEQKIIRMYYGINFSREFTLEEIGSELKITRERVRQVKNKALKKLLKAKETKDKLIPFVEGDPKENLFN